MAGGRRAQGAAVGRSGVAWPAAGRATPAKGRVRNSTYIRNSARK